MNHTKILVIDDAEEYREKIVKSVQAEGKDFTVEAAALPATNANAALAKKLQDEAGSIAVIVLDVDLTRAGHVYASEILANAQDLGIPVVVYAQRPISGRSGIPLSRWNEGQIYIPRTVEIAAAAKAIHIIAGGFAELYVEVLKRLKGAKGKPDPAGVDFVRSLLGAPESSATDLAAYLRGHFEATPASREILAKARETSLEVRAQAFSTALGYWLHNVALQFPGMLGNALAVGAYLDVEPKDVTRKEVVTLLAPALYEGPMARLGPYWWMSKVIDIADDLPKVEEDGRRARISAKTGVALKPCPCSSEPSKPHPSGYVCYMTQRPVCERHSAARASLVPRSAWLSRVSTEWEDMFGPWVTH